MEPEQTQEQLIEEGAQGLTKLEMTNFVRNLVAKEMGPVVEKVMDNIKLFGNLRNDFTRLKNDYQEDRIKTRSMLKTLASANDLKVSIEEATRKINGDIDEIWRNVADFKGMASRMSLQKDVNDATVKKLVS